MKVTSSQYRKWMAKEFLEKGHTEAIYDAIAKNDYDLAIDYVQRVKEFQKAFSAIKKPYKKVLDIACGTGALIDALPFKKTAQILGIDISKNMIAVAKKRFEKYKNIHFKKENVLEVTFQPKSFDFISIAYATRFIPKEKEESFARNIFSWLTDNGVFAVALSTDVFPLYALQYVFWKLFGYPKGFNLPMNNARYFTKVVSPYFRLEKNVSLGRKYIVYTTNMLFFKKKL